MPNFDYFKKLMLTSDDDDMRIPAADVTNNKTY